MKTYNSINTFKSAKKTIATIGTFDGVHIGHRKILNKIIQSANDLNCESLVLTFFPHPRMVLQDSTSVKLLNTLKEKSFLLEEIGIDNLIVHPFDKEFSRLSAEEFVKTILVDQLNIQKIIIGHDHRFGRNRTANINDLVGFGKEFGFEVEQISAQEINENAVSSTKIRNAILDGNIELANTYLGYNYFFSGEVVKGKQLGRTIEFPTANIHILEDYKLIPKNGVYVVKCLHDNDVFFGMMNIGNRPTVNGENQTIEVNLFDFDKEIYSEILIVEVMKFIRDEQKFDSLNSLKNQIQKDKTTALNFINEQ
ncbi:bifunctional riboflavin kinase/FAD synthetase [Flavobacterium sp. SUN052]|uniref:bifunctional riboflavin kinase/FAD synthetase n=1 Tax=Flavobacterium sp. SUN052 TaxID=3002441 RepID=UPI00237E7BBB|nr:bifunctional riboflavin kinase/FAD synthetase [Flavobacterium sp. SUN052]MEC4003306.1 bifunctional riboflavin kinase/FAD synthetase [Flavobacterium sp. SUN052]